MEEAAELGGKVSEAVVSRIVERRLLDEIRRGVQTIQYQVVTLMTTNGQAPFVTVFMYLNEAKDEQEKRDLLQRLGVEREVLFPFREETKSMTPEAFIQEILVERMDAKLICVGEDFRFGCGRRGNVEMLDEYASKYGYELCVFPKICEDGEVISSTRIRRELAEGKIETANRLLGDPYFVSGEVVHGNALGRTIGMPTANLVPGSQKLLPVYGVYASRVEVDGKIYAGVTNVGVKPTVGASQANVETTLLHFDGDLYGKQMKVYFLYFLRPEQRFESLDALKAQMAYDKKRAEELL